MADTKKYLYYGDLLVDELALLTDLADGFASDVSKLSVSNKVKLHILSAGNDIILSGIKGAKPNGTSWEIETGGTPLPLNLETSKYYGYAANLIQKRMKRLATAPVKEEDTETELPDFTSTQLLLSLRIAKSSFGGLDFTTTLWRDLFEDPRDKETGLFGISKRKAELANLLELLKNDLTNNPYNFEGSAFTDVNDYLKRLDVAINALRNSEISEQDLKKSLFSIGLNYDDWFNNGSGDTYVDENGYYHIDEATLKPYTYGSWYNYLNQLNTLKQEAEQKAAEEKLKALDALQVYISKPILKALSLTDLSNKYNGDLNTAISNFSNVNLSQLTQELNDELVSLFLGGYNSNALDDISDDEWELIKTKVATNGEDRSLYRKIEGINGIYYDVAKKNLFQLSNSLQVSSKNFLAGLSDKEQKEIRNLALSEYLQNTEWTADLWRELGGIAADVISVVDPEPISAGVSALTGTGLRTWNRIFDEDGFTLSDVGHTALDAGLSLLGMIPIVGDAALTARVLGKLQKAAGWIGGIFSAASVPLAAKAAWDKVVNGKDLTVDDWRAIGNVFMGMTLARRILLNRAAGNAVKNSGGGVKTEKVGEVEVKVGDKIEKVLIGELAAKELKADYQKAGSDLEKTNQALRRSREVRELLEAKKGSDGKLLYTKEQLDAVEAPRAAASSILGINPIRGLRPTRGITTTTRTVTTEGTPITENSPLRVLYAANNLGFFRRGNYGWNINGRTGNESRSWFRKQWDNLVNPYRTPEVPVKTPVEIPKTEIKPTETPKWNLEKIDKYLKNLEKMELSFLDRNNYGKTSQKIINLGENIPKENYTLADGKSLSIELKDGNLIVKGPDGINKTIQVTDQLLIKQNISKIISDYNNSIGRSAAVVRRFHNDYIESLKKLHKEGWLYKQGGKFTDTQIDNFLKQYRL